MPLDFIPQPGSAFDPGSGLTIPTPRMLEASPPEDPSHTEYQYAFLLHDERIGGLGLFGDDVMTDIDGRRQRTFTLDLGRDWVLASVFRLKHELGNSDDDFSFLQGLARGLVMVFQTRSPVAYQLRYVAATRSAALSQLGIEIPRGLELPPVGTTSLVHDGVVLAQVTIAARVL